MTTKAKSAVQGRIVGAMPKLAKTSQASRANGSALSQQVKTVKAVAARSSSSQR